MGGTSVQGDTGGGGGGGGGEEGGEGEGGTCWEGSVVGDPVPPVILVIGVVGQRGG